MWMEEIKKYVIKNVIIFIVGNKCDLKEDRVVQTEEGEKIAEFYKCKFFETSAKDNVKIEESFKEVSKEVI